MDAASPQWVVVRSALRVLPLDLDPGEAEAISLAKELGAFAVLLDDGEARHAAKNEGLQVTGTIGILERGASAGLIDLPPMIEKLKSTTFYASPELLRAVLDRDAARRRSVG